MTSLHLYAMNRRQAIQQIVVSGTALTLFPGCRLEAVPQYTKIPLERTSWNILKHFSEAILPVDYKAYPAPEPRAIFILNVLNDCTPKKELDKFLGGFQGFQDLLTAQKTKRLDKLENEGLEALFQQLDGDDVDQNIKSFYRMIRSLAKQHFTTSERYMKEELDFRFIPGKYQGNVDISTQIQ